MNFIRVLAFIASCFIIDAMLMAEELDAVIASRGTAKVTLRDIDSFVMTVPEKKRAGMMDSPTRIENVINGKLLQRQLANSARELGLDKDPILLNEKVPMTESRLASARMERFVRDLKIPNLEALAKETYLAHPDQYVIHGQIDVQQILLVPGPNKLEGDAYVRAEEVEKLLAGHPEQFDELVAQYSDDTGKNEKQGLVQDVAKQYDGVLFEAARAIKQVGDISPIVQTKYGSHILKLVRRDADVPQTFAQAHDALLARLKTEFVSQQRRDYVDKLRNLPIDANPELVASLRTRYEGNWQPSDEIKAADDGSSSGLESIN